LTTYHSGWEKAQLDHAIYVELKYGLPVVSHLLLLSQLGAPRSIPERVTRVSGSVRYSLKVNVIRLWRRPAAAVLAAERVAVYPWTALMDATVKEHQEAARRVRVTGREDLQMQMALMGALRYGSREAFFERIGRMLLTKDILRESPLWQEIERDGEAKGRAEGEAKGRAEGEAKALRRSIRVFLLGRFGPLPEWVGERLDGAGTEDLELWLNRTATATSLASVFE
jgi:predicted transposase YdaD